MSYNSQTLDEIIEKYIYGNAGKPSDLVTDTLIRPINDRAVYQINVNEYMAGPGRFARGSMSTLVDQFFRPDAYDMRGQKLPDLAPGSYSKEQIWTIYGKPDFGIAFQQYNYYDERNDIAERTFLWNSTSIKLSDDPNLKFVVLSDGTRAASDQVGSYAS
ncbi:hypothetical protein [Methylorubrum aminovorans]